MKNISKTIVFFGTDDFSLVNLRALYKSGYKIAAVVTKPDSKSGRGQKIELSPVKKFAIENNIDVWQPIKVSDINEGILKLDSNITGVLVSYGKIIPKSTIELFQPGIINVHPSLLPKYRGPSPIESAILNGDKETGVTIIQLSSDMDAGPVYGQKVYKLSGKETNLELRKTLSQVGADTLLSLLPDIMDGTLQPTLQNDNHATYCALLKKQDSWLNQNELTASAAERKIRAYLGFPKTKIELNNNTIIITKAHISSEHTATLDIKCQDNNYLSIDELVAPSGRTMTAKQFLNGYN